jgi:hypothetical protein
MNEGNKHTHTHKVENKAIYNIWIMIIFNFNLFISVQTQQPGGQLQREHVKKTEIKTHTYTNKTQHNVILMINK